MKHESINSTAGPASSQVPAAVPAVTAAEEPIGGSGYDTGKKENNSATPNKYISWEHYLVYGVRSDTSTSNSVDVGKQPKYYKKSEAGMVTFHCPGCQVQYIILFQMERKDIYTLSCNACLAG